MSDIGQVRYRDLKKEALKIVINYIHEYAYLF